MNAIQRRRKRETANQAAKNRRRRIAALRQKRLAKTMHYGMAYAARANDIARMVALAECELRPNERGVIVVARDSDLSSGDSFEFAHGGSVTVVSATERAPERETKTVWYSEPGRDVEAKSHVAVGTAVHTELARAYASPSAFAELWKKETEGLKARGYVETPFDRMKGDALRIAIIGGASYTPSLLMAPTDALDAAPEGLNLARTILANAEKRLVSDLTEYCLRAAAPSADFADEARANPIEKVRQALFGGDARDTISRRVKREAYKKLSTK